MALAPVSFFFLVVVLVDDSTNALNLLIGLAGFSAVLTSLCYNAVSALRKNELPYHYIQAGADFLKATVSAVIGTIFYYALKEPSLVAMYRDYGWFSKYLTWVCFFAFGAGIAAAHTGLWHLTITAFIPPRNSDKVDISGGQQH